MKSLFEEMGGTYTQVGDYFIPDIQLNTVEEHHDIGKWGRMHLDYLRENNSLLYNHMLLSGKLWPHLTALNTHAKERLEIITQQMMENEGVTEELKRRDQLGWVQRCNSIRNRAEEIVCNELIFA